MKCKEIAICKLKWNYTEMGQTGQRRLSATEWLLLLCYRNLNKWDSSNTASDMVHVRAFYPVFPLPGDFLGSSM